MDIIIGIALGLGLFMLAIEALRILHTARRTVRRLRRTKRK